MTERFLLNRVSIRNFKAVRRSGELSLTQLTVFIGNNGSGKSSIIEAMETYCDVLAAGVDTAFERWFGLGNALNRAVSHRTRISREGEKANENPISIQVKGRWSRGSFNAIMELGLDPVSNEPRIERELCKLPLGRLYRRSLLGQVESFNDTTLERVRRVTQTESACPQDWANLCRSWQFLRANPEVLGRPARARSMGVFPTLERDGSNLGQYLLSLRDASIDAFEGFLDALRVVVPYVCDLKPAISDAIERRAYLEMTEENFKLPGWMLSTGTLRVAALLACLRHPTPPPLLIVEEIENGLDPRTLHLVVEEIRAAIDARTTQVILTTHSPYLLDLLDLSHIVVVERVDGEPAFHRPDRAKLAEWAERFAPGRLYTMGRLTRES